MSEARPPESRSPEARASSDLQPDSSHALPGPKGKGLGKAHDNSEAKTTSIADLNKTDIPHASLVHLESVQILCVSKISKVAGKGRKKGKGKDKGAAKGKGKREEEVRVAYLGQNGLTICIAAFGEFASRAPSEVLPGPVNVQFLRHRYGQTGVLHWEENTKLVRRMVTSFDQTPSSFSYDVSNVTQDFATWSYIQDCQLGQYVALVVYALSVEAKWTEATSEPFLVVHGKDMDGNRVNPLRLWRFEAGDVDQGSVYIVRGLKVVNDTYWSSESGKYVPRDDGGKTVEATWRTAAENVDNVSSITYYFQ